MKYKVIVSDYGETLVHTGESVDVRNIDAISEYQKSGGVFCIATGREWTSISKKTHSDKFFYLSEMPIICFYGAAIVLSKSKKILLEKEIEYELLCKMTDFLEQNSIPYSVTSFDKTFIVNEFEHRIAPWKYRDTQLKFDDRRQLLEYLKRDNTKILKIEVYDEDSMRSVINYTQTKMPGCFKVYSCKNNFVELINVNAGKGEAVKYLSKFYNISLEKLIVVGDAINDLEMFDVAINKYAVSNAIVSLLDASNQIVDNTGYLGISRLIKSILGDSSI